MLINSCLSCIYIFPPPGSAAAPQPLFGSTADVRRPAVGGGGGVGSTSLFSDNAGSTGDSGGDFFLTSGGDNSSLNKNKQEYR